MVLIRRGVGLGLACGLQLLALLPHAAMGRSSGDKEGALQVGTEFPAGATPGPGNILILLADDLGVDKVGCYGESQSAPPTPNLDRLAAEGMLFRRAYAMPNCSPTRAALMTGRYGRRTGVGTILARARSEELALDELTLAEALGKRHGGAFATAAVGKWHLSTFLSPSGSAHPKLQGFDHYTGALFNLRDEDNYFSWTQVLPAGKTEKQTGYITTREVDDALALMAELPEPWLIYLAFHAPHIPVHIPPADLHSSKLTAKSSRRDKHDAAVEAMDSEIGRLLSSMDAKVLERTHLVFLGDNGTMRAAVAPHLDPDQSKGSLYEGGIRVPLIVRGPAVAQPGSESSSLVHALDLFPTLLELAHGGAHRSGMQTQRAATDRALDGLSLVPILNEPSRQLREYLYTESFEPNGPGPYTSDGMVMRAERYKLMRLNGTDHLYDLNDGQGEDRDLLTEGALGKDASDELSNAYRELKSALESQLSHFAN